MNIQQQILKDRQLKAAAAEALHFGQDRLSPGMRFKNIQALYKFIGLPTSNQDQTPVKIIADCTYQLTVAIDN